MTNSTAYTLPGIQFTSEVIIKTVAGVYRITPEAITAKRNFRQPAEARMMCFFLLKELCGLGQVKTGLIFGKHHTTVCTGAKRIIGYAQNNKEIRLKFIQVCHNLGLPGEIINGYLSVK